jgi:hypothetical protein
VILLQVVRFILDSQEGIKKMVELEDVPPSVLDLVKIFLASSSREKTTLILETENKAIKTKYMSTYQHQYKKKKEPSPGQEIPTQAGGVQEEEKFDNLDNLGIQSSEPHYSG